MPSFMKFTQFTLLSVTLLGCVFGHKVAALEELTLISGSVIKGTIISQNDYRYVVRLPYGTVDIDRNRVAEIKRLDVLVEPLAQDVVEDRRLMPWSRIVDTLATQPWAFNLKQIPATVIDVGVMANVPYTSFRCGTESNWEVNIYGNMDDPVAVEVGIYGNSSMDAKARQVVLAFASKFLVHKPSNQSGLLTLREDAPKFQDGDLVMEVTEPSAPDAYGAWWVGIYFQGRLDKSRANPLEMREITQQPVANNAEQRTPKWDAPTQDVATSSWTNDDVSLARKSSTASKAASSSHGSVYVRGYVRKDGTYVSGHSRKR